MSGVGLTEARVREIIREEIDAHGKALTSALRARRIDARCGDSVRLVDENGHTLSVAKVACRQGHTVTCVREGRDPGCGCHSHLDCAESNPSDVGCRCEDSFELRNAVACHHEAATVDLEVSIKVGVVDSDLSHSKNSCSVEGDAATSPLRTTVQASAASDAADTRAGVVSTPVPAPARDDSGGAS